MVGVFAVMGAGWWLGGMEGKKFVKLEPRLVVWLLWLWLGE